MKFLILVIIAGCYSLTARAQYNNVFKNKPWEELKLKRLLLDTLNRVFPAPLVKNTPAKQNEPGVVRVPLKGTFLGENGKGDEIYAMQPDNMPCLVPGKSFRSNMPVAGGEKSGKALLPLLEKGNGNKGETDIPK